MCLQTITIHRILFQICNTLTVNKFTSLTVSIGEFPVIAVYDLRNKSLFIHLPPIITILRYEE